MEREGTFMAEQEPTIVDVIRLPDLIQGFGPNSRSGFSNPVRAKKSNGTYINLYFHRDGESDIATGELVGLTQAQALSLVKERDLHL
jgi:acetoacetate decarboxylase